MRFKKDIFWKYAPVWVMLFSTSATLLKKTGERYLLEREWELQWSDLGTAVLGAAVGYGTFRMSHGNKTSGVATR